MTREVIDGIKSTTFPHLNLIQSVDETCTCLTYKGNYMYLVISYLEVEANLMMYNIIPFL